MTAKKIKLFFLSLILIFICTTPILPNQASASSFVIILRQDVTLNIGEEYQLFPLSNTINIPQFKSSNSKVATVSALGKVIAKKPGTAKITVTVGKENTTCQITVRETKSVATIDDTGLITAVKPGTTTMTVSANGTKSLCNITVKKPTVKLDRTSIKIFRGQSYTLTASVSSRISPTYKSNKKSVAIVDSNGTITAMKHGVATITATVDGVSTTCIVTVKQPEITLNQYEIHMEKGDRKTLYATVSSGNTPVFSTSNSNVITVDKAGKISAIKKGTAYVYCQEDGVKVKCKVIVSE